MQYFAKGVESYQSEVQKINTLSVREISLIRKKEQKEIRVQKIKMKQHNNL